MGESAKKGGVKHELREKEVFNYNEVKEEYRELEYKYREIWKDYDQQKKVHWEELEKITLKYKKLSDENK